MQSLVVKAESELKRAHGSGIKALFSHSQTLGEVVPLTVAYIGRSVVAFVQPQSTKHNEFVQLRRRFDRWV